MAHFTTTDGVRIYYESHGTGDPLLLAYGIGGNAGMWRPNVHALASRHRLILWEPRGHARSESPADPTRVTFGHWVLDLKDLLDHLRLTHAVVGGLSLGGGIATRFALSHPEPVRALVVIDSSSAAGLPLSVENVVMRAKSIEVTLRGRDGRDGRVRDRLEPERGRPAQARPVGPAGDLRLLPDADPHRLRQRPAGPAPDGLHHRAATGDLAPTLLICGDEDPSLQPMRVMEKKVKQARFVLLSPAGHFANRDQPEAFNRALLEFLDEIGPA